MATQQEQIKELTAQLEQGVKNVFNDEYYQKYLKTMSTFHNYSARNTMLIFLQRPDATNVAGFNTWKNNFGRFVSRGEKGIQIFAPAPYKKVMDASHDAHGIPYVDENGKPYTQRREITVPAFKPVYVFDISQTSGRDLPEIPEARAVSVLSGDVENYEPFFEALRQSSPMPIEFQKIQGSTQGYTHFVEQRIVLDENQSQLQNISVALHEITHARLHADRTDKKNRNTKEVEAESVAFVVSAHYGIQTDNTSFSYIAGWSDGKELAELQRSLDTIQKESAALINDIDAHLQTITQQRAISQELSQQPMPIDNEPYRGNPQNYKYFYAGAGGQDRESEEYQRTTGWNRIWASDGHGMNGDTWIVYKNINDLPKHLRSYAETQESEQIQDNSESIIIGNSKYAESLIDQYEQYGTPEWHSVFGAEEKNLLSNYALHEADRNKIDALAAELAAQRFELEHGFADTNIVSRVEHAADQPKAASTVPSINRQNGRFAEDLIDDYEQYDTPQWNLVFGGAEKALLINYAMHQEDIDKIALLASKMAEQKHELTKGFVNPNVRESIENFCNDIDRMNADYVPTTSRLDRAFAPTIEILNKTAAGYAVSENGEIFSIFDPDPEFYKINSIDLDSGERVVVGFSRTQEYTFEANDYRNCLFENNAISVGLENLHFEGYKGLWMISDETALWDSKYYLATRQDDPSSLMIVNDDGTIMISEALKDAPNQSHYDFQTEVRDYLAQQRLQQAIGNEDIIATSAEKEVEFFARIDYLGLDKSGETLIGETIFYDERSLYEVAAATSHDIGQLFDAHYISKDEFIQGTTALKFEPYFGVADEHGYYKISQFIEPGEKSVIIAYNPTNQEKPFHVSSDAHAMENESDITRHYESYPVNIEQLFIIVPDADKTLVRDIVDSNYFAIMQNCEKYLYYCDKQQQIVESSATLTESTSDLNNINLRLKQLSTSTTTVSRLLEYEKNELNSKSGFTMPMTEASKNRKTKQSLISSLTSQLDQNRLEERTLMQKQKVLSKKIADLRVSISKNDSIANPTIFAKMTDKEISYLQKYFTVSLPLESLRSTAQTAQLAADPGRVDGYSGQEMSFYSKKSTLDTLLGQSNTVAIDSEHEYETPQARTAAAPQRKPSRIGDRLNKAQIKCDTRAAAAPSIPNNETVKSKAVDR